MLYVNNLSKEYSGGIHAVKDLSFTVDAGHVYGFLGANGAGKTTTMNMITGALAPTFGQIVVCGYDMATDAEKAKSKIGYLPENPPLYPELTVSEYLSFIAQVKKIPRPERVSSIKRVMHDVGISKSADMLISTLSKGYKQRVGIAQAMLGDPEILILDEPTVGLDPKQVVEIRSLISKIGKDRTVILSSHILSEVAEICDRLIIISNGELIASGDPSEIRKKYSFDGRIEICSRINTAKMKEVLLKVPGIGKFSVSEESGCSRAIVVQSENFDLRERIFNTFADMRCPIIEMRLFETSLEDLFLRITSATSTDSNRAKTNANAKTKAKTPASPVNVRKTAATANIENIKQIENIENEDDNDNDNDNDNDDDDGDDYRPLFGSKKI